MASLAAEMYSYTAAVLLCCVTARYCLTERNYITVKQADKFIMWVIVSEVTASVMFP